MDKNNVVRDMMVNLVLVEVIVTTFAIDSVGGSCDVKFIEVSS